MMRNAADPVTTEIVRNFVISCAEDMNASLWRSAHSAVIYEGRDSAVALLDADGNMLGPVDRGAALHRRHRRQRPPREGLLRRRHRRGRRLHHERQLHAGLAPARRDRGRAHLLRPRAHRLRRRAGPLERHRGDRPRVHHGLDGHLPGGPPARPHPHRREGQAHPGMVSTFSGSTRASRMRASGTSEPRFSAIRTGERRPLPAPRAHRHGHLPGAPPARTSSSRRGAWTARQSPRSGTVPGTGRAGSTTTASARSRSRSRSPSRWTASGSSSILAGTSGPVAGSVNCGASQTVSLLRLAYKTMINPDRAITGGLLRDDDGAHTRRVPLQRQGARGLRVGTSPVSVFSRDLFISCLSEAIPERSTAAPLRRFDGGRLLLRRSPGGVSGSPSSRPRAAGGGRSDGDGEERARQLGVNGAFRNIPAEVMETKFPGPARGVLDPHRLGRGRGPAPRRVRRRPALPHPGGLPMRALVRALPHARLGAERGPGRRPPGDRARPSRRVEGGAPQDAGPGPSRRGPWSRP